MYEQRNIRRATTKIVFQGRDKLSYQTLRANEFTDSRFKWTFVLNAITTCSPILLTWFNFNPSMDK